MGTLIAAGDGRVLLDYAVVSRPFDDALVSGDAHLVLATEHGVLLATIDGLGHGPEAAAAARSAQATLAAHAGEPVTALLGHCHLAMQSTRGAAMAVAFLGTDGSFSWAGIGNVEGMVLRRHASPGRRDDLLLNYLGGVVGYRMPKPRNSSGSLAAGDLLIFATDGIAEGFESTVVRHAATETIATTVMAAFGRHTDDALVFVARWLGDGELGNTS